MCSMKEAACEQFLLMRECDGTKTCTALGDEREGQHVIGRVLGQFISDGWKLYHGWANPTVWIVQRGSEHVVIERITLWTN